MLHLMNWQTVEHCYIAVLILLISVLMHRRVLKNFGLWRKSKSDEDDSNFYNVVESDAKTSQIMRLHQHLTVKDNEEDSDDDAIVKGSEELLIINDDDDMILYRHELTNSNDAETEMVLRPRFRNRDEIFNATAKKIEDEYDGSTRYRVQQDGVDILLQPTKLTDKTNIKKTLEVEEMSVEISIKYQLKLFFMTLRKYFFIDDNLARLFESKPKFQRTQYDVYKFTFFCEILNFFVLLFGFTEFNVSI